MNIRQPALIISSFCFAALASASNAAPHYICHHGDNTREILVAYDDAGSKVPCQVVYKKGTGEQILWRAEAEEGYCEEKASTFAAKQEGWGWECSDSMATPDVDTEEAVLEDDTSVESDIEENPSDDVIDAETSDTEEDDSEVMLEDGDELEE